MTVNGTSIPLEGKLLLATQFELVCSTAVAGCFYGIAFVLFCQYVYSLIPQIRGGDRKRQAKFMLVYTIIMMLCGLYFFIANIVTIQDAYIKHANYPGGPYLYEQSALFHGQPVLGVGLACQAMVNMLTSAIQIWRVWIIWKTTEYANFAIVLPSLCFLVSTALQWRTLVLIITLPAEKVFELDSKTNSAENALQGATTMLCTVLISGFLIFQRRRNNKTIGESRTAVNYMSIVAMLVESYTIESVWIFGVLSIDGLVDSPVALFFGDTAVYIEIIAYLLVQYRVARGRAYESQKDPKSFGSLKWNISNHVTDGESDEKSLATADGPVGQMDDSRVNMA
ncbi:hypothetical protein Agabi119p4_5013 [Agaricus bisporus var. burnettii]|uniref:Uncharacterized protein n=1 Tax=Agaricus bisporus var. burnettii TaxID=192524 RepID=A0A8H7F4H2_AGABI|nr:hypothetical protein Agabi119p4_5013 [Agaricus bisporus var. burnettii]